MVSNIYVADDDLFHIHLYLYIYKKKPIIAYNSNTISNINIDNIIAFMYTYLHKFLINNLVNTNKMYSF